MTDRERTSGGQGRRVRFLFEPRDLWFGVHWRTEVMLNSIYFGARTGYFGRPRFLVVFVTVIPMFPIRVWFKLRPRWESADGVVEDFREGDGD